jgi:hypothetical protein
MKTRFSFIPIIGVLLGILTTVALIGIAITGTEKSDSACVNTKFTAMFAPYDSLLDRPFSYITGPEYDIYSSSCVDIADGFAWTNVSWSEERNLFGFKKIKPANNLLWMWMWFVNNDLISFKYNHGYSNYVEENNCADYNYSRTETNSEGLQLNFQTPLLDGSGFYKRSLASNMELRLMDGSGKLKSSTNLDLPAHDNVFHLYNEDEQAFAYYSDKDRILHVFYALLTREHNYWCDRLLELNPSWQEDDLYNVARHIVMGEIQAITYRDALPVLLGKDLPVECYHDQENALTLSTDFATIGMNIVLSMVPDVLAFRSSSTTWDLKNCSTLAKSKTFWNTGIENWLVAAYHSKARPIQPSFTNNQFFCDITNYTLMEFLLSKEREYQLPYYGTLYHHYTGKPLNHFRQITTNPEIFLMLQATYNSVQDVGLLVGLLAEDPQLPSLLGKVGTRMFSEQFKMIRTGQGRFYLWDIVVAEYRAEIHHTKLSTLILRHTNASKKNIHPGNTFQFISN